MGTRGCSFTVSTALDASHLFAMKLFLPVLLAAIASLAFSGEAIAQVKGDVSPNNVASGSKVTVSLTGLPPGSTVTIVFAGVGEEETEVNGNHEVTVDSDGEASWYETINWPAGTYATNISYRVGSGQPGSVSGGTLTVTN